MVLLIRLVEWLAAFIIYVVSKFSGGKEQLLGQMLRVREGLKNEAQQTKDMLNTYNRFLAGVATKSELKAANLQFMDVLRTLGLGVLVLLPLAPIILLVAAKIAEKLGFHLFPDSFRTPPASTQPDENKHLDAP